MSIPTRLRIAGWIVSLIGAGALVASGGFDGETRLIAMSGAVVMVLGITLTSTSPLVANLQERRRIREQIAALKNAPPGTPSKPG
jgi:Kef-type K+ transport system membrane component KefB